MPSDRDLCRTLAGLDDIGDTHAQRVLDRARQELGTDRVDELKRVCRRNGLDGVAANAKVRGLARAIVYCLYTGMLPHEDGSNVERGSRSKPEIRRPEDYFESVLWRVIHAQPRAVSGGYFGHWHYPPEKLDDDEV